jgi:hypothetical protein
MRRALRTLPAAAAALVAFMGGFAPHARARAVESDIVPADKRRASVERAELLAKRTKPMTLPATLPLPFAPANFDLTDAEEAAAAAAAARLANAQNPNLPAPPSDHQLLEEIVAKVRPSGTVYLGGRPLLMFGKRFVKTGAHFTVTYKGNDYDFELTGIDGTNFTLRYKNDEITRPIQTAKSP